VVRFESVRTVISLAIQNSLKLYQLDVITAFLNLEWRIEGGSLHATEGFVAEG